MPVCHLKPSDLKSVKHINKCSASCDTRLFRGQGYEAKCKMLSSGDDIFIQSWITNCVWLSGWVLLLSWEYFNSYIENKRSKYYSYEIGQVADILNFAVHLGLCAGVGVGGVNVPCLPWKGH